MYLPVAYQASLLGERFAAHVADVDPLTRVQEEVLAETAVSGERSCAHRTAVRFVAGVNPHVFPEVVVLEERFPALLANGLLLFLVLGQHVLVQVLFGHQSPVAHRTLVLCFVMSVFLMRVQTVTVPAGFPAHVAYHGWFPVVQSRVGGQIALDLELFAALLAGELVTLRMLPHEMGPERFFARANQPAYHAGELSFAGELALPGSLVILGQMGDHGRPLVAPEVAAHARQCLLFLRRQLHERGVLRGRVSPAPILVHEFVSCQQVPLFELFVTDITRSQSFAGFLVELIRFSLRSVDDRR